MYLAFLEAKNFLAGGGMELFLVAMLFSALALIVRWIGAALYKREHKKRTRFGEVLVIIPVVDEPEDIWREVLSRVKQAVDGFRSEVIVVCNGNYSKKNYDIAKEYGFTVLMMEEASKRKAIALALASSSYKKYTVILDSDTLVDSNTIARTLETMGEDCSIGGITPRHTIYNSEGNIIRRISAWMEDERFTVTLRATNGAISCLPGRFLAIKTYLLREYMPGFVSQRFLGVPCETGDDRYLTQRLVRDGYRTIYQDTFSVQTNAPDTLLGFVKQRTRWSRSSIRETILAIPYMWRYPMTFFVMVSNVVSRWLFFAVVVLFILNPKGIGIEYNILIGILLFFLAHAIRQIPHLWRFPKDLAILPAYAIISSFVLLPVEWYGNMTMLSNKWLTRKTTI